MVLVSLYATYDIAVSLPKIAGMVLGIGAFYVVARAGDRVTGWWWSLAAFLGAGVGIAGIGLLGTRWIRKVEALQPIIAQLPSGLVSLAGAEQGIHPNELAGALLWVIPPLMALAWLVVRRSRSLRARLGPGKWALLLIATLAANVLALGTFILAQSRSSYLGLALALPAMLVAGLRGRARWAAVAVSVISLAAAGAVATSSARGGTSPGDVFNTESDLQLDTLNGRLEIWSRAIYGLQDFPFTGMGMNTFRHVVHILYPLFLIGPDMDIAHAHNEFLQAGLDLGIPGLIAFIALYIGAFWMLLETRHQRRNSTELNRNRHGHIDPTYFTLSLGAGLLAHLIYGLTDAVALGAKPGFLFWMLLGLIAGLHRQALASAG
jgi:putative inorganic carbon (HCO3(-)) transporter